MNVPAHVLGTVLNGVASLVPQILGLVLLGSLEYGKFAVAYLTFSLALSILLSALCDPWAVLSRRGGFDGSWSTYASLLGTLSVAFGILSFAITWVASGDLTFALAVVLPAIANPYRVGVRYFLMVERQWTRVLLSDALSIAGAFLGLAFGLLASAADLSTLLISWGMLGALGSLAGSRPSVSPRGGLQWLRSNHRTIRPLLADSFAMDVAAVGTPYILLPLLKLADFGIYRAISTLSAPIRLVTSPLRPLILSSPSWARRRSVLLVVVSASVIASVAAGASLAWLQRRVPGDIVIADVSHYPVQGAVYVLGAALLSYFPLVVRSTAHGRTLAIGRAVQTACGVAFPIIGFLVSGLDGAIWGFSIGTVVSSAVWSCLAVAGGAAPQQS